VPPAMVEFFGHDGLERADCALSFALSTPRPSGTIEPGHAWKHSCEVGGITAGVCQVNRQFIYTGTNQLRRHRFAEISIAPAFKVLDEKGKWIELPKLNTQQATPNYLQLLIDTGLTFAMRISLERNNRNGGRSRFLLSSTLVD